MVVYIPSFAQEFTLNDANVTVVAFMMPRVGNAGYSGRRR